MTHAKGSDTETQVNFLLSTYPPTQQAQTKLIEIGYYLLSSAYPEIWSLTQPTMMLSG